MTSITPTVAHLGTMTLTQMRSTPEVFAQHVTYERRGNKLTRILKTYRARGGKWVCTGSAQVPYSANKDWSGIKTEKGSHGRTFTAKRDWLKIHTDLAFYRGALRSVVGTVS